MSGHTFPRALPVPDGALLRAAVTAILGAAYAAFPELDAAGVLTIRIDKPTAWTAPEIAAVQAAITAAAAASPGLSQQADVDAMPIWAKALALALIDETNRLRAALRGLGVAGLPDVTVPQAIAAVRNKAGTL